MNHLYVSVTNLEAKVVSNYLSEIKTFRESMITLKFTLLFMFLVVQQNQMWTKSVDMKTGRYSHSKASSLWEKGQSNNSAFAVCMIPFLSACTTHCFLSFTSNHNRWKSLYSPLSLGLDESAPSILATMVHFLWVLVNSM